MPQKNQEAALGQEMEYLMITVSGKDRPGIAAAFAKILLEHSIEVVDIEQASLQDLLGLSMLLDTSQSKDPQDSFIKDLLFEAHRLNLSLNFRLYSQSEVQSVSKRNLYVLTYFGGTAAFAALSKILGEENVNIETITSLPHQQRAKVVEMVINVNAAKSLGRLKNRIMSASRELGVDLALQKMEAYRKNKRLILFDMDSTLVDMEVIDELAALAGVGREVARITEKAMRGDLDFEESLTQRVALLKGLNLNDLQRLRARLRLSEGVEEVTATLKRLGYKLGVVTGGFDFFAENLRERLGFDYAFANRLEIKNGLLTGRVLGPIIDAAQKARLLNQVAVQEGILLDQTVAVGDGANDALMLGQAGLGIAYNAKSKLDKVANVSLGRTRLMSILYLLGVSEEDMAAPARPNGA